nr:enoyl-CoA hydratase/isomerase family protein [Deltaproteobacteria bacterium]
MFPSRSCFRKDHGEGQLIPLEKEMISMEKLRCEKLFNDQVWKLVLNDPKGNVVDSIMLKSFAQVFAEAEKDKHCKLFILQGEGKHFSFGVSVEEHTADKAAAMLASFNQFFLKLTDLATPVVSLISGQCLGGGLEMAMFAHVIFADESAKMGQPEIGLGVFAPPASVMLPAKLGQSRADDLLLTGRIISAQEAKQSGLVNEVYPDKSTMEQKLTAWIEEHILPKSAHSLRVASKVARWQFNKRIREDLEQYEAVYTNELINSHDGNEGINAFLQKRKPEWKDE